MGFCQYIKKARPLLSSRQQQIGKLGLASFQSAGFSWTLVHKVWLQESVVHRRRSRSLPVYYLLRSWLTCLIIARQAFAHSWHAFAHSCICLSSGVFSQAALQMSQAFAHASQMVTANGPWREAILAAAAQNSAQSTQVCRVVRCSFLPEATR